MERWDHRSSAVERRFALSPHNKKVVCSNIQQVFLCIVSMFYLGRGGPPPTVQEHETSVLTPQLFHYDKVLGGGSPGLVKVEDSTEDMGAAMTHSIP